MKVGIYSLVLFLSSAGAWAHSLRCTFDPKGGVPETIVVIDEAKNDIFAVQNLKGDKVVVQQKGRYNQLGTVVNIAMTNLNKPDWTKTKKCYAIVGSDWRLGLTSLSSKKGEWKGSLLRVPAIRVEHPTKPCAIPRIHPGMPLDVSCVEF